MINGVHHVTMSTPDMERAVRFYADVLGFEVRLQGGWEKGDELADEIVGLEGSEAKLTMLSAGNLFIELQEYASPDPSAADPERPPCDHGLTHFCLDVVDIEAEYQRLTAAGMSFFSPPVEMSDFGVTAAYGRDPDGNIIEIQEIFREGGVPTLAGAGTAELSS